MVVSVVGTILYVWVYPVLLWAPLLLAKRLRALFKALPPTDAWLPAYLLTMGVAAVPFLAALVGVAAETGIEDGAMFANTLLQVLSVIGIGYVGGAPSGRGRWTPPRRDRLGSDRVWSRDVAAVSRRWSLVCVVVRRAAGDPVAVCCTADRLSSTLNEWQVNKQT